MPGSVFPSAPGYPQYSGTAVIPPKFSTTFLSRFYASTVFAEISTMGPYEELRGKGDTIYVPIEPKVSVSYGTKDGIIDYDTLEVPSVKLTLDQILQFGFKFAELDIDMSNLDLIGTGEAAAAKAMALAQDIALLSYVYTQVDPANAGANAGVNTGLYNLGQPGAPVVISSGTDLFKLIGNMAAVLTEQSIPEEGRYVVLPEPARSLITRDPNFLLIGAQGGYNPQLALDGRPFMDLFGMRVYFSQHLPRMVDPGVGLMSYYAIAGIPEATAFATVMDRVKIIDNDKDDPFATFVAGQLAYGFEVVYPNALATAYVHFDPAAFN